jgi:hypothetical protein
VEASDHLILSFVPYCSCQSTVSMKKTAQLNMDLSSSMLAGGGGRSAIQKVLGIDEVTAGGGGGGSGCPVHIGCGGGGKKSTISGLILRRKRNSCHVLPAPCLTFVCTCIVRS